MAIAFGGYYRVGDAFSPAVEFEMNKLAIGFAYDMNISGLTAATGGNGGPEIFIRFQNPGFVYGGDQGAVLDLDRLSFIEINQNTKHH